MDLSPRDVAPAPPSASRAKRWLPILVLVLVLVAGGVVVTQFLTRRSTTTATSTRSARSRAARTIVACGSRAPSSEGSIIEDGGDTAFIIGFNGVDDPGPLRAASRAASSRSASRSSSTDG